ncbi:MAG: DNA repair protein RecO [Eubacteriaceae bacterium]|nr:DNA repair protein RecO [Eubacteriaceae bacterium]MDD4508020.1 DNA repair protein RecO [Eubacteriaceae bacterium]
MALVKTKALVIREQPFQDQDKILTLFTEKEGKQRAIAKGVRRKKNSLSVATQLFALSRIVYYPGKNFAQINEASLIQAFYPLRQNVGKMALASYLLELIDGFYDVYQGDEAILKVVTHILYYLSENKAQNDEALIAAFQLKLSGVQGIGPVLDRCVGCNATKGINAFSIKEGGVICAQCGIDTKAEVLSESERQVMLRLLVSPVKEICVYTWNPEEIHRIVGRMNAYIVHALGRRMKSYDFYRQMIQ